jgi:phosphohistidine swiveling domain-containing protein
VTETAAFAGLGAAPGRAIGEARVLRTSDDERDVPAGSIVVARIIHPHVAPLFLRIAGVVVEEGALLQHATTLAREFGVPAVVGVADATRQFLDGDRLEIDGSTGEVLRSR